MSDKTKTDEVIILKIKPYKLVELAAIYGVSRPVLRSMMQPYKRKIGLRMGHYYSIRQVKYIISKLGMPGNYVFTDNQIRVSNEDDED
jgi:hypothetical protein